MVVIVFGRPNGKAKAVGPTRKENPTHRWRAQADRPGVQMSPEAEGPRSGQRGRSKQTMSITQEKKQELIQEFGQAKEDTGSPEVQIAILTSRINSLTTHMQRFKKDHSTRRGLLSLVSRRRGLLDYLKRVAPQRYLDIIARLHIRK